MGISRRKGREPEADPFYDMLFNMLIAFVFCFVIAILAFNPNANKSGDIPAHAEFIITMSWPDMNPNDLDTWIEDPGGHLVWFRERDSGLMHLDRDDRGLSNDILRVNGQEIANPLMQRDIFTKRYQMMFVIFATTIPQNSRGVIKLMGLWVDHRYAK